MIEGVGEATMTTLEILRRARELIRDEEHWIRSPYWQDKNGDCGGLFEDATKFCLVGAVSFMAGRKHLSFCAARRLLAPFVPNGEDPIDFNETHPHADVLAVLNRAIAAYEVERG